MSKDRIVKVGFVLVLAAAAGFYLENGPRLLRTMTGSAAEGDQGLTVWREPRRLPDIAFTDSNARPMRLSGFRGKMILLNIWATWCLPCRKEMPALDRLQASLGGADFEVIALSVDRDGLSAVKAFYRQTGIAKLRIYRDQSGETMSNLGVAAIPTTLLINWDGDEIGRKIGPAEWDSSALVKEIALLLDR
jgi:thiol-disulfide isomerase/thioredoxin